MPVFGKRFKDTFERGIGMRIKSKNEAMQDPAGFKLPAGVKLYIPHSKPKAATVKPDIEKMRKK